MADRAGPGWHPDPSNPDLVRWWDGQSWGEQTSPRWAPAKPETTRQALRRLAVVLGVAMVLAVGVVLVLAQGGGSSVEGCARVMRQAIDTGSPAAGDVPGTPECTHLGWEDYARAKTRALQMASEGH